jgi:methionine salvage enolase-phosphatase E1
LNITDEWTKEVKLFSNCSYLEEESSSHAELSNRLQKYSLIVKYFDTTCSHKKEFQEYPNIFLKIKKKTVI